MYDDDFLSSLMNKYSSTTTTEEQDVEEKQDSYRPSSYSNPGMSYDDQDYSSTQNFTEQKTYNSTSSNTFEEPVQEKFEAPTLNAPMIKKEQPTVNLIKKRARLVFETRMKVVMAVFSMIVACLLFVTVFNFIEANRIQSTFADKQIEIASLKSSISALNTKYAENVSKDGIEKKVKEYNESVSDINDKFVEVKDYNTIVVNFEEFYEQPAGPEKLESNWFNDVCEFLSSLFA